MAFKIASTLFQKKINNFFYQKPKDFVYFRPYDFVQISPACGPNAYQKNVWRNFRLSMSALLMLT